MKENLARSFHQKICMILSTLETNVKHIIFHFHSKICSWVSIRLLIDWVISCFVIVIIAYHLSADVDDAHIYLHMLTALPPPATLDLQEGTCIKWIKFPVIRFQQGSRIPDIEYYCLYLCSLKIIDLWRIVLQKQFFCYSNSETHLSCKIFEICQRWGLVGGDCGPEWLVSCFQAARVNISIPPSSYFSHKEQTSLTSKFSIYCNMLLPLYETVENQFNETWWLDHD